LVKVNASASATVMTAISHIHNPPLPVHRESVLSKAGFVSHVKKDSYPGAPAGPAGILIADELYCKRYINLW
jgi:hypothetical protein